MVNHNSSATVLNLLLPQDQNLPVTVTLESAEVIFPGNAYNTPGYICFKLVSRNNFMMRFTLIVCRDYLPHLWKRH